MQSNILVFGNTGMLGSMVFMHLSSCRDFNVFGTTRNTGSERTFVYDASKPAATECEPLLHSQQWDYWINCIGVIKPHCRDNDPVGVRNALRVNACFPHELASVAANNGIRLIQISTDCVYSGNRGGYIETDPHDALDVYGKTKSLGEVFDGSALNVRVSIIGPELNSRLSLLEWFLSQPSGAELNGFTHHKWNGVTTLRYARLCKAIIEQSAYDALLRENHVHHYVPADTVSKYDLLVAFQSVFGTDYRIRAVGDVGPGVDRTLKSNYNTLGCILRPMSILEDLRDLRAYTQRTQAAV